MKKIQNEIELINQLQKDVIKSNKNYVLIQAGHFPLMYAPNKVYEALDHWGEFSKYSLEIGAKIGKFANDLGKKVGFVLFADDHSYQDFSKHSRNRNSSLRKILYNSRSGCDAKLPKDYEFILNKNGFDESHIIKHNHNKKGRENCLYFSEMILRDKGRGIDNACAREYLAFFDDDNYFNKQESHIISFVPRRCKGHICDYAIPEMKDISSSHVFMETMVPTLNREELYTKSTGVWHRND